ncbi:MAG: hypothetical protein K8U57_30435 [Planctomycetes bacterium]|nr:hypothetical protein [Planctomycetota bacterium]
MTAAPAVNTSGSQTATISTEHSLATITSAKTLQLVVDAANLVGGSTPDILELTIYTKARSSDTKRILFQQHYMGAQSVVESLSPPHASPHYFEATLKQTQGTGRAFPWAINEL